MRYQLNPSQKREPFGGHHFRENGVTLKGDTVQEVVELLTDFRIVNGKPVGNPLQEIIDYYAKDFPWMVEMDISGKEDKPDNPDYVAWRSFISSVWGKNHGKFLTKKEASFRWAICKGCPHNVGTPWPESREATEFSRKSLLLRRGENIPEKYCYCDLHRNDIGVVSFQESASEFSRKETNKSNHSGCWV